jgi:hypothetical protein
VRLALPTTLRIKTGIHRHLLQTCHEAAALKRSARSPGRVIDRVSLVLILAGVLGMLCAPAAWASTTVSSNVSTNTTWTAAGSPYIVTASINVNAAATLTIEPGVEVQFSGSTLRSMAVLGTIRAIGAQDQPIVFTSAQGAAGTGVPGQYMGVRVSSGNSNSEFAHVRFQYGGTGSGGFYAYGVLEAASRSSIAVRDSRFKDNAYSAIKISSGSMATVTRTTMVHNGDGVSVLNGQVLLRDSIVTDNADAGVFFNISTTSSSPGSVLSGNDITRNGRFGIRLQQFCSDPLSAFPSGSRNNIYNNGAPGSSVDGRELSTLYTCRAIDVDWSDNYWGDNVFIDTGEKIGYLCVKDGSWGISSRPSLLQPAGWLAYRESRPSAPNPGPISTAYDIGSTLVRNECHMIPMVLYPYNAFYIGPGDVQPSFMPEHEPVPMPVPVG